MLFQTDIRFDDVLGIFSFELLDIPRHKNLITRWVKHEKARFWCMSDMSDNEIAAYYQNMQSENKAKAYIGKLNERPLFLFELYDPEKDEIAECYTPHPQDIGMHFLVAPKEADTTHGLSQAVLNSIIKFIYHNQKIERIIVEPDVRNDKIHVLNKKLGFEYQKTIKLSYKKAYLAFLNRANFAKK